MSMKRVALGLVVMLSVGLSGARAGLLRGGGEKAALIGGSVLANRPADVDLVRTTRAGSQMSEGDAVMGSDKVRAYYGVTGTGITVGILSDTIDQVGAGIADSQATGDLPAAPQISVLKDYVDGGGSDEGRAMAEIIHDVAPGANLMFHTAWYSEQDFADGILALAAAGCDVIVDDVAYRNEPYFQDGIVAQAVETVVSNGVAYFSSAGNQFDDSYQAVYSDAYFDLGAGDYWGAYGWGGHDFDASDSLVDLLQSITVQPGGQFISTLQWTQPYGAAASDLDLILWEQGHAGDTDYLVDVSWRNNMGGDPWEIVGYENDTDQPVSLDLEIPYWDGPWDGYDLKMVYDGYGYSVDEYHTYDPTIVGHAAAPGAAAVGAVRWSDPNVVEWFSSHGPTDIRFDAFGNPAPEMRQTPAFAAPDGVSTSVPGFGTFYGTSASAPHAAAVAALMMSIDPTLTPAEIVSTLQQTAAPIDGPGWDPVSGFGRVDAYAASLHAFFDVDTLGTGTDAVWTVTDGGVPASATGRIAVVDLIGDLGKDEFVLIKAFYTDEETAALSLFEEGLRLSFWDVDHWATAWNGTNVAQLPGFVSGATPGVLSEWFVMGAPAGGLGYYGVDTSANYVWAYVDHASQWSIADIPEPTTVVFLSVGLVGLLRRRRRK